MAYLIQDLENIGAEAVFGHKHWLVWAPDYVSICDVFPHICHLVQPENGANSLAHPLHNSVVIDCDKRLQMSFTLFPSPQLLQWYMQEARSPLLRAQK